MDGQYAPVWQFVYILPETTDLAGTVEPDGAVVTTPLNYLKVVIRFAVWTGKRGTRVYALGGSGTNRLRYTAYPLGLSPRCLAM